MNWLLSILEAFGLSHPNIFITGFILVGALGGYWGGFNLLKQFEDGIGTINGIIKMEDNGNPINAKLRFYMNNEEVSQITPDQHGSYNVILKQGSYKLQVAATGYVSTEIPTVQSLKGTNTLNQIELKVLPQKLELELLTKSGSPIKGLKLQIENIRRQMGSNTVGQFQTDNSGKIFLNDMIFSEYRIVLVTPFSNPSPVLWNVTNSNEIGHFLVSALKENYKIILPLVKYGSYPKNNIAEKNENKNFRFFARSLKIDNEISPFCSIGIGIGLGESPGPKYFEIRKDVSASPSNSALHKSIGMLNAASITTAHGTMLGNFCSNQSTPLTLPPGVYWLVAVYENIPNSINVIEGSPDGRSAYPPMASSDGNNWKQLPLPNNYSDLSVMLFE